MWQCCRRPRPCHHHRRGDNERRLEYRAQGSGAARRYRRLRDTRSLQQRYGVLPAHSGEAATAWLSENGWKRFHRQTKRVARGVCSRGQQDCVGSRILRSRRWTIRAERFGETIKHLANTLSKCESRRVHDLGAPHRLRSQSGSLLARNCTPRVYVVRFRQMIPDSAAVQKRPQ